MCLYMYIYIYIYIYMNVYKELVQLNKKIAMLHHGNGGNEEGPGPFVFGNVRQTPWSPSWLFPQARKTPTRRR